MEHEDCLICQSRRAATAQNVPGGARPAPAGRLWDDRRGSALVLATYGFSLPSCVTMVLLTPNLSSISSFLRKYSLAYQDEASNTVPD